MNLQQPVFYFAEWKMTHFGSVAFRSSSTFITHSARPYLTHAAMGWFIVVGIQNHFLSFMTGVVANAAQAKLKQAASLDEALQTLRRLDATMPGTAPVATLN